MTYIAARQENAGSANTFFVRVLNYFRRLPDSG